MVFWCRQIHQLLSHIPSTLPIQPQPLQSCSSCFRLFLSLSLWTLFNWYHSECHFCKVKPFDEASSQRAVIPGNRGRYPGCDDVNVHCNVHHNRSESVWAPDQDCTSGCCNFTLKRVSSCFYATEGGGEPLESGHKLSFEFRSVHSFLTVHLVFHKPFWHGVLCLGSLFCRGINHSASLWLSLSTRICL